MLVSTPQIAYSQTVTINWFGRGWYKSTGDHQQSTTNYVVGDFSILQDDPDYRDFFVFDLSGLPKTIASAKLALYVPEGIRTPGYFSNDPSENFELHDVNTPAADLILGTGGVAAHGDLGSGVVYGSRMMTPADMGSVVEIELNAPAIAAMNATSRFFSMGGSLTTLDNLVNQETVFNATGLSSDVTQLRLTFVPEPISAALVAFAAMIFGMQRSRKGG